MFKRVDYKNSDERMINRTVEFQGHPSIGENLHSPFRVIGARLTVMKTSIDGLLRRYPTPYHFNFLQIYVKS